MKVNFGLVKCANWLTAVLLTLLISACADDDFKPKKSLDSYNARYMIYPGSPKINFSNSSTLPIVNIKYDGLGRITKKIGGLLPVYYSAYDYYFFSEVYDDLEWSFGKVKIVRKESLEDVVYTEEKRSVFYIGEKIMFIVLPKDIHPAYDVYDTTFFFYESDLLVKTVEKHWLFYDNVKELSFEDVRHFIYESENLVRIEGRKETYSGSITTTLETFEGYDDAYNPTKDLIMFEEVFYRSLSKNNFSKYNLEKRDADGNVIQDGHWSWDLRYDEEGIPTFK